MKLQMRPHNTPGLLITFCGLDGCGKSTQIAMLEATLKKMDIFVSLTKQPTDFVRQSDIFRAYMDQPDHDAFDYRALSLLCASDRVQHCNRVIRPRLATGDTIISDRYFYSCLANLKARGYMEDLWIYEIAESIPKPDVAFFLDVPVETAVARVRERPTERDRYIDMDLQYRLREEYILIARKNSGIILNSEETPEQTHQHIIAAVNECLVAGNTGADRATVPKTAARKMGAA